MAFHALLIPTAFFLILCNIKYSVAEPRATEAALICSNRTAAPSDRQVYVANFLATMDLVTPQVDRQRYGVVINGTGNNTVYTYGECMKDLSQNDCNLCFAQCKTQILRCLPFQRLIKGGRLYYDGCYLRYDDYMFFNESLSAVYRTVCGSGDYVGNRTLFRQSVGELVRDMSVEGVRNDGFFTGSVRHGNVTVYGLAQCWELVSRRDCKSCLRDGAARIESCNLSTEGRVLNSGCYLRYSITRFYNNSDNGFPATRIGGESHKRATIIASVCGSVAFLLLMALISISARRVILRRQREKKKLGSLLDIVTKSKSNFSYETLEKATDYFSNSNKLGQGGSGTVYKGILPNGQTVAVKRLFFNTAQWAEHFFNEVNLISDIHHNNLVKLLGCSITGPESLLVYEYVPNQSLHDYLFVRKDVPILAWEERYKIVLGTAEGLCYLHEESKLRIIHRDIKLSNVLLNRDLTPRIADFGLARLFPEDKTHISTGVAGTLGYMAPEYIVRGKLTEKADVYSFGVLVIEVVTGTRNNVMQNTQSILQTVWSLHGLKKLTEAVDPSINGNFPEEEATLLLQVGLLCVQASAELRPCMSVVVKMLTGKHELSQPTQPPFLNTNAMEIAHNHRKKHFTEPDSSSGNDITESIVLPR